MRASEKRFGKGISIQKDPDIDHNHVYNPITSKGQK